MPFVLRFTLITDNRYGAKVESHELNWGIYGAKPTLPDGAVITSLRAGGDELRIIDDSFDGIPICDHVCTWEAPWAHFIFTNLRY